MTILKIERFRLIQEISKEVHATVFEALNEKNNQSVHIRLYPSNFISDESKRKEFEKRGAILNRISHPGILPVYQYGSYGDQPYIVSPVMGGGSLKELLERSGKIDAGDIVPIAERIAEALDALHAQQAVHGNINPDSVWFNAERTAYLGGYIMPPPKPNQLDNLSAFSPEYLENNHLHRQSDIYSLTVLLYQMLTGKTPFIGKSANEINYLLLHDQIPKISEFDDEKNELLNRFFKLGLDYVSSNRPIFASELVARFKNIFRISSGFDQKDTAVHDALNDRATKVNPNSDAEFTPDFEETPDWMFVFGEHDRAKKQTDYSADRFPAPIPDEDQFTVTAHGTISPTAKKAEQPDSIPAPEIDLDKTNVFPNGVSPSQGNQTGIPKATVTSSHASAQRAAGVGGASTAGVEWPDQKKSAGGGRSRMLNIIIGLIALVFLGGITLFGLSVFNIIRQPAEEETAVTEVDNGEGENQAEGESQVEPATDGEPEPTDGTTAENGDAEPNVEPSTNTPAVVVETGPIVNIPSFDLSQVNSSSYTWESFPPSTSFLRRSRSTGFSLEEAGWYMYSNGNKIRDVLQIGNRIFAASGAGLTVWDLDAGSATRLTTYDGLVGNDINQIVYCEIPEPRLLLATESGLGIMNLETLESEILDVEGRQLINNQVSTVTCNTDRTGTKLYVGYTNDGLTIHDLKNGSRERIDRSDGLPTDAVRQLILIDDTIWINTGSSLMTFNLDTTETVTYSKAEGTLPTQNIIEMVWDNENTGLIWMATNDGLMAGNVNGEFSLYTDENTNLPRGLGKSVGIDPNGTVWYGTGFGNLCAFDVAKLTCDKIYNHPTAEFQLENAVSAVDVSSGRIVYGHQNDGVLVGNFATGDSISSDYNVDTWQPLILPDQFPTNEITALAESDGFIYVGTRRGLYKAPLDDLSGANWEYFDASNSLLPSNWVTTLFADPEGGIWVGTFRGAVYLGEVWIEEIVVADQQIRAISRDNQDKNIWIGTEEGLFQYNGRSTTEMKDLPTINIRTMLWVRDDLFLGLEDGRLGVLTGGVFNVFDRSNSPLSPDPITVIQEGPNDTLYIGNGDDLYVLNPARSMIQIPQVRGFYISDVIFQSRSNETLVSTTSNSMYYYNSIDWEKISVRDGLPSNRIQELLVDSFGTIWFAGASTNDQGGGLARYIPYPDEGATQTSSDG